MEYEQALYCMSGIVIGIFSKEIVKMLLECLIKPKTDNKKHWLNVGAIFGTIAFYFFKLLG